jgi:hypothetical protein
VWFCRAAESIQSENCLGSMNGYRVHLVDEQLKFVVHTNYPNTRDKITGG